jgi:hypothetical protein
MVGMAGEGNCQRRPTVASEPLTPERRARLEAVAGKASTADKTYWLPGDDDLFPAIRAALAHIDAVTAERDRLWVALEQAYYDLAAVAVNGAVCGSAQQRTLDARREVNPPPGRTRPKDCSICRREDCTRLHDAE